MRRTVSLVISACLLLLSAGVANATSEPNATPEPPAAGPDRGPVAPGPEEVGTIEAADTVLGYLGGARSATLHYPGAEYVKVHLSQLLLLPGDHVTVADPAHEEVYRYEAEPLLGLGGGRWATSITGDTAVVTLHRSHQDPLGTREALSRLGVTVDKVARGFVPGGAHAPAPTGREETVCGGNDSQDAVCYRSSHPQAYQRSKAVARLLIGGRQMCTAFRVGAGNRLLTNHHCITSTREARSTEIWFNYQCAECGGWEVFRPTKVRGDRVLATHSVLDFTLFTVDDFARVKQYGYLELDTRRPKAGEELYIPQHPAGGPTRIAMDSDKDRGGACAVQNPSAHGYGWNTDVSYLCDTQGGSSGSPVLSRTDHKVVGLHHFGGCPNSGVRIDLIYRHISSSL